MARFTFRLPDIGEGIAEAEIVQWHVAVGDRIEEDSEIADLMTDKATVAMESPVTGIVVEVAGDVGDMVAIGSPLAVIEVEGEAAADAPAATHEPTAGVGAVAVQLDAENPDAATVMKVEAAADDGAPASAPATAGTPAPRSTPAQISTPAQAGVQEVESDDSNRGDARASPTGPLPAQGNKNAASNERILSTPAVRARARDLGIDLAQVKPSEDGRIRHGDLDGFLRYNAGAGFGGTRPAPADEAVRVIGMRRRIAENMAASKRAIPHFTYVDEVEVTKLEELRADLNANRSADADSSRPKLTMLPLLIVAICRTLPQFPMLNARYDDEAGVVNRSGAVHVGMATQTAAGLMVPVIRDAQARNVWQLAAEIARLAQAARDGTATSAELSGSTLTITSLGPLGGIATTPVINRPEVAIIGPNKIVERPVFDGDDIRRAKLMNVSISCDHRVVDGWDAASFVQALKKLIETPVLLFAD